MNPIRVLVVEDSTFMQEVLARILNSDSEIKIVGIAKTGKEAMAMAASLHPDVVTLDVILPDVDGLEVLWHLVRELRLRVMVLSATSQPDSAVAMQAFDGGAIDCLLKPGDQELSLGTFHENLLQRIKEIATIDSDKLQRLFARLPEKPTRLTLAKTLVVIGASAGGPMHLREIIPKLPVDLPAAVLVVQHLPATFTRQMAVQLGSVSDIRVKEAHPGDIFVEGTVYVAPGDQLVKVEWVRGGWGAVSTSTLDMASSRVRPWIDASMATAALLYGKRCVGVLLSGMGSDGVEGMCKVKEAGGVTLAQDESTSFVYGMPKAAADAGVVDRILPVQEMAGAIISSVKAAALLKQR